MNYLVQGPRGHLQSRRPGQPHRQHARPAHRSRHQLPQPADAARGVPPPQPATRKSCSPSTRQIYGKPDVAAGRPRNTWCGRPTSTASTRPPASTTTSSTTTCSACAPASLRLTNVYGPRQLLKHNRQGFIALVHPPGARGQRDPGLRRRLADARFRLRRRCGRRVPARRARPKRATVRSSTSAATSTSRIASWSTLLVEIAGTRQLPLRRVAGRRRRRSTSAASTPTRRSSRRDGLGAGGHAARRAAAHPRVLPRSTCTTTSAKTSNDGAVAHACAVQLADPRRRSRRRRCRASIA